MSYGIGTPRAKISAGHPSLFKGATGFGLIPTLRRESRLCRDSKRRHAPPAELCDTAVFSSDEQVFSRDEQAAEFVGGCRVKNANVLAIHASRDGNNTANANQLSGPLTPFAVRRVQLHTNARYIRNLCLLYVLHH
jgi:hypothetical protein